jgi:DUF1365 family protein
LGGIHWEALKLWRKGIGLRAKPPPPAVPVTIVHARTPRPTAMGPEHDQF